VKILLLLRRRVENDPIFFGKIVMTMKSSLRIISNLFVVALLTAVMNSPVRAAGNFESDWVGEIKAVTPAKCLFSTTILLMAVKDGRYSLKFNNEGKPDTIITIDGKITESKNSINDYGSLTISNGVMRIIGISQNIKISKKYSFRGKFDGERFSGSSKFDRGSYHRCLARATLFTGQYAEKFIQKKIESYLIGEAVDIKLLEEYAGLLRQKNKNV